MEELLLINRILEGQRIRSIVLDESFLSKMGVSTKEHYPNNVYGYVLAKDEAGKKWYSKLVDRYLEDNELEDLDLTKKDYAELTKQVKEYIHKYPKRMLKNIHLKFQDLTSEQKDLLNKLDQDKAKELLSKIGTIASIATATTLLIEFLKGLIK